MSLVIMFYFTSSMLNMFRTLIHPSSGACDFSIESPHWSCVLVSMCVGVSVWLGCQTETPTHIETRTQHFNTLIFSSKYIQRTKPIHRLVPNTARIQVPDLLHLSALKGWCTPLVFLPFRIFATPMSPVLFDMGCRLP